MIDLMKFYQELFIFYQGELEKKKLVVNIEDYRR